MSDERISHKDRMAVLSFLFDKLPINATVDSLDFSLSGAFTGKFYAAYAPIQNEDIRVVFSLPSYGRDVFVALCTEEERDTALILANIEDYERETGTILRLGDIVKTASSASEELYGVILLRPKSASELSKVPDEATITGLVFRFFFVVPITHTDHIYFQSYGYDALMDYFSEINKDILFPVKPREFQH